MSNDITYNSSFGERGSGNGQFEYPGGLVIAGNSIFLCDSQNHRIQELTKTGLMIREFGNGFLSFPHSIVYDDGSLYITDSGNHRVVVYSITGDLLNYYGSYGNNDGELNYPTGILVYGDYLFVVDSQNNRVQKLLKSNGQFIDEITTDINYPFGISIQDSQLYVTQPHGVWIYNLAGKPDTDFSDKITTLSAQLYPTGRAWWKKKNSIFDKIHQALSLSESRVENDILNLQYDILADSVNMSLTATELWESVFGITAKGTISDRLSAIYQRQMYPNNELARQSKSFIQNQLQLAGFDVYLHNSNVSPNSSIYGIFQYGQKKYNETVQSYSLITNEVDETKERPYLISNIGEKFIFVIGSEISGEYADVSLERKNEFRELVLRLKPAHSIAVLNINFT